LTQTVALRRLGDSEIEVTVAGLGCNNFGRRLNEAASVRVVHAALDLGINFFDTSDSYGNGQSEHHLGVALKGRRDQAIVLTKFGSPADADDPGYRGASPDHVRRAIERSLRNLDTDYIDVYMLHRPDPETPIEATLEALDRLVREGRVRALANSNFAGWQIADADWVSRTRGLARFVAAENEYSLLERSVEREVVPACRRFGLSLIPFFPLGSGLLTGKYRRGQPAPEGTRLSAGPAGARILTDRNFDIAEGMERLAAQRGVPTGAIALGWLAAKPEVCSVIAGATSAEQVEANVEATSWTPTEEDIAEIDRITGR
jgi:aryl-alcohol dehydrogenase-like predicted oxidoreductase